VQTTTTCHSDIVLYRSVPSEDSILVPETLLKKRKSQEKERAAKAAEIQKKRDVSTLLFFSVLGDDTNPLKTRPCVDAVFHVIHHLSGLIDRHIMPLCVRYTIKGSH
jgi:hypothetical protein